MLVLRSRLIYIVQRTVQCSLHTFSLRFVVCTKILLSRYDLSRWVKSELIFRYRATYVVANNMLCFIYLFKVKVWQALYSMYNKLSNVDRMLKHFFAEPSVSLRLSGLCLLLWVKQSDTPLTSINADVEVFLSLWNNYYLAVCFLCLHTLFYYTAVVFISLFVDSMKSCFNIWWQNRLHYPRPSLMGMGLLYESCLS